MADALHPPTRPPGPEQLVELFRRTVSPDFAARVEGANSQALIRGMAAELGEASRQIDAGVQASYYLPSSVQRSDPASCGGPAVGEAVLSRTGPREFRIYAVPGAIQLSSGGRVYINLDVVEWQPGEAGAKSTRIACQVVGTAGNLDHVVNADGSLDLEYLEIADQDQQRVGDNASTGLGGGSSWVQDTGVDALFRPEDVGLHVRIEASPVAADVGSVRRITGFEWPEVELPPGSGRYPRRALVDPAVHRRPLEAQLFDQGGGTYTDVWAALTTVGPAVQLHADTVGDALYLASPSPFHAVQLYWAVIGDGDWSIAWEYWDGATWQALPDLTDLTDGWRQPGQTVAWTAPATWTSLLSPAGTGVAGFFVRARLAAWVSTTTAPQLDRAYVVTQEPLGVASDGVTWRLLDYAAAGLELTAVPASPTGGTDNELWFLGDDRGVYQAVGEGCEAFRGRASRLLDVVSPAAIQRAVSRTLAPLGLTGLAVDLASRDPITDELVFPGMFFDVGSEGLPSMVSAFDLYAPGDVYPLNKYHLPLSYAEAFGWFFVLIEAGGAGEFGLAFDDGPVIYDELDVANGPYLGPAFDTLYFDGAPTAYHSAVASAFQAVDVARAAGVGFTLIKAEI